MNKDMCSYSYRVLLNFKTNLIILDKASPSQFYLWECSSEAERLPVKQRVGISKFPIPAKESVRFAVPISISNSSF